MYDGPSKCHLIDWSSSKVSRKVRSTLASEAASSSRAYDRAVFLRCMMTGGGCPECSTGSPRGRKERLSELFGEPGQRGNFDVHGKIAEELL